MKKYWLPTWIGIVATLIPVSVALDWMFSKKVRARKLPYLSRLGHAYFDVATSLCVPRKPSSQAPRQ